MTNHEKCKKVSVHANVLWDNRAEQMVKLVATWLNFKRPIERHTVVWTTGSCGSAIILFITAVNRVSLEWWSVTGLSNCSKFESQLTDGRYELDTHGIWFNAYKEPVVVNFIDLFYLCVEIVCRGFVLLGKNQSEPIKSPNRLIQTNLLSEVGKVSHLIASQPRNTHRIMRISTCVMCWPGWEASES